MQTNNGPQNEGIESLGPDQSIVALQDQQAEMVIMNMWTRMKSLEGKYIDLANYYKQELVTQGANSSGNPLILRQNLSQSHSSKSAVSGVIQPDEQNNLNEDAIINDLKSEKIRFEQNFKSIIENKQIKMSSVPEGQTVYSDVDLIRFNNELQGAFKDILDSVELSQTQSVNNLGQRQTEMFQLSTKYRLPSGYKNDAIGVWYDAKSQVTQTMSELKGFIQEKGTTLLAQALLPNSAKNVDDVPKVEYSRLIERFEIDMVNLKRSSKDYTRSVQLLQQALQQCDQAIQKDKQVAKADYKDLLDAIGQTSDLLLGRPVHKTASRGTSNNFESSHQTKLQMNQQLRQGSNSRQPSNSLVMSPFDKRMSTYSKGAFGRSNSRSGITPKPPKQYGGRKPSNQGLISPLRTIGDKSVNDYDWHPDLTIIRSKLEAYDNSIDQLLTDQYDKQQKVQEIAQRVEDQIEGSLMKFLATHDTDMVKQFFTNTVLTPTETAQIIAKANLQAHAPSVTNGTQKSLQNSQSQYIKRQTSVSPYRRGNLNRKTTPTRNISKKTSTTPSKDFGNSGKFTATGDSIRLQELQSNTDQLFGELRKANDKYIEQQVENRRLKDQNQVLSLQIEDLRIQNNRFQKQAQSQQNLKKGNVKKLNQSAQEMHSPMRGGDIYKQTTASQYSQDNELIQEQVELCTRIDQFFTSMKILQRAVNKKEDISEVKVDFESKQRALQKLSKQIQARSATDSYQKSQEPLSINSDPRNSESAFNNDGTRNRSQSTRVTGVNIKHKNSSHRQVSSPLRAPNAENDEIIKAQSKKIEELNQQILNAKAHIQRDNDLVQKVKSFENQLYQKYQQLQQRLEQRESELDSVKRLFVEKLKELESNFAEIGDHLIANQNKPQSPEKKEENVLQQYLTEDQDEKALEELIQTNSGLHDQINELKQNYKDFVAPADHKQLKDDLDQYDEKVRVLQKEKQQLVKMFDTLSKERDSAQEDATKAKQEKQLMSVEVAKMTQTVQQSKLEKEQHEMSIQQSIKEIQQNLKDEIEQKVCFQKEARDNEHLAKLLEEENESMQSQMEEVEMARITYKQEVEKVGKEKESLQRELAQIEQELQQKHDELIDNMAATKEVRNQMAEIEKIKDQIIENKELELIENEKLIKKLEDTIKDLSAAGAEKQKEEIDEIAKLKSNILHLQQKETQLEDQVKQEAERNASEIEELEDKLKKNSEAQEEQKQEALLKERQNWWMTALQLRVKRIITDKIEAEKKVNEDLMSQLSSKEEELKLGGEARLLAESKQQEVEELKAEKQSILDRLQSEMNDSVDKLTQEKQALLDQKEILLVEKNAVQVEKDALKVEKNAIMEENVDIQKEKDLLVSQIDQVQTERDTIKKEKETALIEKETENQNQKQMIDEQKKTIEDRDSTIEKLQQQVQMEDLTQAHELEIQSLNDQIKQLTDETSKLNQQISEQVENISHHQTYKTKVEEEIEGLQEEKKQLQQKNMELESKVESLESLVEANKKEAESQHESQMKDLQSHLSSLQTEMQSDLAFIEDKDSQIKDLTEENQKIKAQIEEIQKENLKKIEELDNEINDLKEKLEKANKDSSDQIDTLEKQNKDSSEKIETLEKQNIDSQDKIEALEKEKQEQTQEKTTLQADKQKEIDQLKLDLSSLESEKISLSETMEAKITKLNVKIEELNKEIEQHEENEKSYKQKLDAAHQEMSSKVETEHENVKKVVDVHKTNEELSKQLLEKVEQNKALEEKIKEYERQVKELEESKAQFEADLESQKVAYETVLEKLTAAEEQAKKLESDFQDLNMEHQNILNENKDLEEKLNKSEKPGHVSRNSIGSDDEYTSVSQMKDDLKHARSVLINFIQKLPYSAPDNEATLPILCSMFEFSKEEQEKMEKVRSEFNAEKLAKDIKDGAKAKSMFGNMFTKNAKQGKVSKTEASFNSGGNISQGNK